MMRSKRTGNRYLAGLVIAFAIVFLVIGTLGPAHRSPYYLVIVPLPTLAALILGLRAWTAAEKSTAYSTAALLLLLAALVLAHLLPKSVG
jgi:hypothetical protein